MIAPDAFFPEVRCTVCWEPHHISKVVCRVGVQTEFKRHWPWPYWEHHVGPFCLACSSLGDKSVTVWNGVC